MELGLVGLGRMGGNMARRLRRGNVDVVAYNRESAVTRKLAAETGLKPAESIDDLVRKLISPRAIWFMLPAGDVTQEYIDRTARLCARGDLIVEGGNSHYKDSIRRAGELAERGIRFVDAGVSGGVWGLEYGYGLMVGGDADSVRRIEPALRVLAPAPDRGWLHCGPVGAGHFVKMVHNGIEYGLMQAYAEGLALLHAREDLALDVAAIAEMWRHGSVVRSWLLDLTAQFLAKDPKLTGVEPYVADSGEGRWTAIEAIEQGVPAPVMSLALMARFASRGNADYADRLLALMRQGFGGHEVKREPQ